MSVRPAGSHRGRSLWVGACLCSALTAVACGREHRGETPKPSRDAAAISDTDAGEHRRAVGPSLMQLLKEYSKWTRRTPEPLSISSDIWALCRLPSLAEQAFVDSKHGGGLYLLDWINAPAARALAAGGQPAFPVGAAIVKEKLERRDDGKLAVVALGLMIKRGPGFDPNHGDWEFGYWEPAPGLSSGAEPARHCGGCHAGSKTDFVFVDSSWRNPQLPAP